MNKKNLFLCSSILFSSISFAALADEVVSCPAPSEIKSDCNKNECVYNALGPGQLSWQSSKQRNDDKEHHRKDFSFSIVYLMSKKSSPVSCQYRSDGYERDLRLFAPSVTSAQKESGNWEYNQSLNRWQCTGHDQTVCKFTLPVNYIILQ